MAEDSGFRVDRLGSIDARTGGKGVDRIFTILDYPWIAIWMSPRETIRKIVNRDPTHQVIMLAALAGALVMLNSLLSAALGFTPTPLPKNLVAYLPILTFASPFIGAAFGVLGLYLTSFMMDWTGRVLGGVGNAVTVRAAVAWSEVPQICLSIVMLLILLGTGVWKALDLSMPDPNAAAEAAAACGEPVHADARDRSDHFDLVVHLDAALRGRGASFFGLARVGRVRVAGLDLCRDRDRGQSRDGLKMA